MTIYVGIDGSDGAAEAARWAAREGELRGLPVTAVVAWDYLNQRRPKDGAEEFDPAYSEDDALSVLDKWVVDALGAERATAWSGCPSATCRGVRWSPSRRRLTCSSSGPAAREGSWACASAR